MVKTFKLIYDAAKVRLGFLIMACAMAGIAVSPNNDLTSWQVLVLGVAVLVSSSVSGAFNQLYERDLDARMKRTRGRAFVTGKLQANGYWLVALALLLLVSLVAAALATNIEAAVYLFLGAFTYGIVYTVWLKTRTWMNIVIGGLAGSFAVMAGAAATGAMPARKITRLPVCRCCRSLPAMRYRPEPFLLMRLCWLFCHYCRFCMA